jgi:NTP pyrophosphatase (non-canonical NTP hydrolase)
MTVFTDVEAFMRACGHTPDPKRVSLYLDLVREEVGELEEAMANYNIAESNLEVQTAKAEILDAICDSIWVLIGLSKTMDLPVEWGWDEVTITNLKKIDAELGTVLRDENGKIMKPPGWRPPNMLKIIQNVEACEKGLGKPEVQE